MYEQLVKVCPTVEEYKVRFVVVNCKKNQEVFAENWCSGGLNPDPQDARSKL